MFPGGIIAEIIFWWFILVWIVAGVDYIKDSVKKDKQERRSKWYVAPLQKWE